MQRLIILYNKMNERSRVKPHPVSSDDIKVSPEACGTEKVAQVGEQPSSEKTKPNRKCHSNTNAGRFKITDLRFGLPGGTIKLSYLVWFLCQVGLFSCWQM